MPVRQGLPHVGHGLDDRDLGRFGPPGGEQARHECAAHSTTADHQQLHGHGQRVTVPGQPRRGLRR